VRLPHPPQQLFEPGIQGGGTGTAAVAARSGRGREVKVSMARLM
jgi:hypothetical protein